MKILRELLLLSVFVTGSHGWCREPPNLNSLRCEAASGLTRISVHVSARSSDSAHCPTSANYNGSYPLHKRTLCPWKIADNQTDPRRIPQMIPQVECLCKRCVLYNNNGLQTTSKCHPVIYHSWVLRRNDTCNDDGYYVYNSVLEPIKVGCVCAPPTVRESRPRPWSRRRYRHQQ